MSVFDYFIQTSGSRICPVGNILPREAADPARLARALEKMALARSGIIPKRLPIRVVSVSNGGYRVVDGNTTYHALVALGETNGLVEMVEDR
ncbi:hypothetical protein [Desulfatirhabdium butyrativorans]|uniref:hypothetical protein n=1 Tax=Desulfatirhabdium butyrativorans TaxID=340467 RepID=UPI0003FA1120|nr:hypothetical protein [Desulfatirhabdium butyrativorans]